MIVIWKRLFWGLIFIHSFLCSYFVCWLIPRGLFTAVLVGRLSAHFAIDLLQLKNNLPQKEKKNTLSSYEYGEEEQFPLFWQFRE